MADQTLIADEEGLRDQEHEDRAELSGKTINDLPDSAFAYIEPGGSKDAEGKTTPRSLRHFPVHDEAHARNALAQAPKSPFGEKAMPKILAACKKFGIEVAAEQKDAETQAEERAVSRRKERHRAIPLMPEVRHFRAEGLEIREKADTNELIVTGAPIKYDVGYRVFDIFGEFEERMRPGCVSELLQRGVDCRLLLNHDGLAMARTTAGTLRLWDTPAELRMEATLDARQQLANDFAIATERGDMTEMSVGMFVGRDLWGEEDGVETRDVLQLDNLLDVSGVTFAASPTTNIEIAQRMALAMPLESQARVRRIAVDLRAGKMLSDANAAKIAAAHEALNSVLEAAGLGASNDGESESTETALAQDGTRSEDGEPIRSTKASTLRLQMEARSRKRKALKKAA